MKIEDEVKKAQKRADKIENSTTGPILCVTDIVSRIGEARNADAVGDHELADRIREDLHKAIAEQNKQFTPEQLKAKAKKLKTLRCDFGPDLG